MNSGFYEWWEKINKLIMKGLAVVFLAMLLSQTLLMNQTLKTFISRTDRLEGKAIAESQLFIKKGELEISIENEESINKLVFYINGVSKRVNSGKTIKLQVKDSDVIEVSGAEHSDMAILRVTSVSENMAVPELGKLIYVNNNLVMVDRVRLK